MLNLEHFYLKKIYNLEKFVQECEKAKIYIPEDIRGLIEEAQQDAKEVYNIITRAKGSCND